MAKTSLNNTAYQILLDRIVSCHYLPGHWLNEERLVSELGISRTPIHAALIRLQQEGLVQIMPKKGIHVAPITAKSVRDLFNLRDLIEPHAIYNYADNFEKDKLMEFLATFSNWDNQITAEQTFAVDAQFHITIVGLARNDILSNYYQTLQNQLTRIAYIGSRTTAERLQHSNKEHADILLALLQDDREQARNRLLLHLKEARQSAYQTVLSRESEGQEHPAK